LTAPDDDAAVALERPRDLNGLLSESFAIYRHNFWTFLAIAFVVVVPVNAAVLGVGLGQFSGGYDSTPAPASALVPALVQLLVVGPLVAVMVLYALQDMAGGEKPNAGRAIQSGLEAFSQVFWPVLIAVLCEAGTLITIILPFVLIVRWYFVPQLVVLEGSRGAEALRESWELTRGFAWRTAGMLVVVNVAYGLAGVVVTTPLTAVASSADSEALSLLAATIGETLVAAPLGICGALIYYDVRARKAALDR
jgi:hypothetical protein